MAEDLTASSFTGHEGSTFTVHFGDDTLELTLDSVVEHDRSHQESFSLLFRGPKSDLKGHDTFRVAHDALGENDLFLGPISTAEDADDDEQHYEATFARLKEHDPDGNNS